jgi:NAD(P)-dependent dehydrogenase (short-subunit alcohol dehydrogenase family)
MPVILVTGGNRGIGYAIVQVLGSRVPDTTVLVGCRSIETAQEPVAKLRELGVPAKFEPIEITITDNASIRAAVHTVKEKYGKLDGEYFPNSIMWQSPNYNV